MPELTTEAVEKIKHAADSTGVHEPILSRWSPRAFLAKEVSPEILQRLFSAAAWAPSSMNEQPWRFLVGIREDETYRKIFESLSESNQSWAGSAPVLALSAAKKSFSRNGAPNYYALHDTGAATAYLALEAAASGLRAHSMGGFDRDKARAAFSIPQDYEIGAVTAVGYFGNPSQLADRHRQAEISPRQRRPLETFVFSSWDRPLF